MTPTPAPGLAGLRWGVVAQVKASLVAVQTFVAWHLQQGATQIWIYFDDPTLLGGSQSLDDDWLFELGARF